jgi:hypothetical protein
MMTHRGPLALLLALATTHLVLPTDAALLLTTYNNTALALPAVTNGTIASLASFTLPP